MESVKLLLYKHVSRANHLGLDNLCGSSFLEESDCSLINRYWSSIGNSPPRFWLRESMISKQYRLSPLSLFASQNFKGSSLLNHNMALTLRWGHNACLILWKQVNPFNPLNLYKTVRDLLAYDCTVKILLTCYRNIRKLKLQYSLMGVDTHT